MQNNAVVSAIVISSFCFMMFLFLVVELMLSYILSPDIISGCFFSGLSLFILGLTSAACRLRSGLMYRLCIGYVSVMYRLC